MGFEDLEASRPGGAPIQDDEEKLQVEYSM